MRGPLKYTIHNWEYEQDSHCCAPTDYGDTSTITLTNHNGGGGDYLVMKLGDGEWAFSDVGEIRDFCEELEAFLTECCNTEDDDN